MVKRWAHKKTDRKFAGLFCSWHVSSLESSFLHLLDAVLVFYFWQNDWFSAQSFSWSCYNLNVKFLAQACMFEHVVSRGWPSFKSHGPAGSVKTLETEFYYYILFLLESRVLWLQHLTLCERHQTLIHVPWDAIILYCVLWNCEPK